MGYLDRALTEAGVGVLRFDFTGLGDSEGEFANTSFTSNVSDVVAAAEYLAQNYQAPRLLIGHSFGGAAVIQAARDIPSTVAVATIAAPSEFSHLSKTIVSQAPEIERTGEAEVMLAGRRFHIKKQFVDDLERRSMAEIVGALRLPLLTLHAPEDDIVPMAAAELIFKMAHHPKSLVALDRADHLLLNQNDAEYAGRIIASWFGRYLS
jgi:alpha-beta hydrolase superfamily lysophospholipase